jgi:hypothetical protein
MSLFNCVPVSQTVKHQPASESAMALTSLFNLFNEKIVRGIRMNGISPRHMRMTIKSSKREQTMNATKRSVGLVGLVFCSALALGLAGCRTVVHERTNTVYVPAPAEPAPPPPVVSEPPPTVIVQQPPPVVVIQSENDFYEPLAAHGRWVVIGSHGRCWVPARVEVGWRPYCAGHWERTDAGWYWESEEPWGWATYHYGRWDWDAHFGWYWVPQTQWAPAWVVWREGGGYVGWAPLRPSISINVNIRHVDYEPAFSHRAFVFVEQRRMLEPVRPKTVVVNNTTIINKTVNITNVKVVNKTVINEGPRPDVIERQTGRKLRSAPVHEVRRKEETTVVARERNVPTAERRIQSPTRTDSRPAQRDSVKPRNERVAEQPTAPAVKPLPQPTPVPTREVRTVEPPARNERPVSRTVENKIKPQQPAPHGREVWPDGKPMVSTKPKSVTPLPGANETLNPVKQPAQTPPTRQLPPGRTAREERGHQVDKAQKGNSTPPGFERKAVIESKPAPAVAPTREVQRSETPAAARQLPVRPQQVQPAIDRPTREARETENTRNGRPVPPGLERKTAPESTQSGNENPQVAPQTTAVASPEKSRKPQQSEDEKQKGKAKGKKKGQEQEKP